VTRPSAGGAFILLTHVIFGTKDRAPLITAPLHDDLLAFLRKHGIAYDERYLWL
jgi:hypothetical protein